MNTTEKDIAHLIVTALGAGHGQESATCSWKSHDRIDKAITQNLTMRALNLKRELPPELIYTSVDEYAATTAAETTPPAPTLEVLVKTFQWLAIDAHPTYASTAGWHGGIGGSALTRWCHLQDPPPSQAHLAARALAVAEAFFAQ